METKSLFASKTVWGVVISLVAVALQRFGFSIGEADQAALVDTVIKGAEVAGLALALFGRVKATKVIGKA